MQRMLLDKRTRDGRANRTPQRRNPHAPETLDVSFDNAIVPALGQPVHFVDRIPDPPNDLFRAGQTAETAFQPVLEHVLEDGGGDCDADRAACAAERVGSGCDDGLVFVFDCGDEGDEADCEHAAVGDAAHEEVEERCDGVGVRGERGED